MKLLETRLLRLYFNLIYNPLYDIITAKRRLYLEMQNRCVSKLHFNGYERVLCAGVGTGNEIIRILNKSNNLNIVGVDYSESALNKAIRKAYENGVKIETSVMDLRNLKFEGECFDKVLCIHVMDFIEDYEKATSELIRVLKPRGEFVITYPAETENPRLAVNLIKDGMRKSVPKESNMKRFLRVLVQILLSFIYIPLLLRSNKKRMTPASLTDMFTKLTPCKFRTEPFLDYNDFIVFGTKL